MEGRPKPKTAVRSPQTPTQARKAVTPSTAVFCNSTDANIAKPSYIEYSEYSEYSVSIPWLPSWQPPWPHPTTVPTSAHAGASPPIETSRREDHHLISTITDRRKYLGDKMIRQDNLVTFSQDMERASIRNTYQSILIGLVAFSIYTHFFLLIKEGECCIIGGRTESQR